ncbi:MAG: TIGR03936 family radical SAM-associated protein [Nocardioides sp.]|nr:TIGR03936 family radical SAM-associated protein [Nocardioides sp.]
MLGVRAQPEQQAPPVQRVRVRYAKRGRLRFTSHRDFSRAFERAVVRARVPMAYSSGFHPHPRISYAGAAPTGSASEAEYLELGLAEEVDPEEVRAALDAALPDGLDVLEAATSPGGSLADLLEVSHWRLHVGGDDPELATAVERFLAAEEVEVERMTKKGLRTFDCRAAVLALDLGRAEDQEGAVLDVVLRHGTPSVRPDDVLTGLREAAGWSPAGGVLQQRLAQGAYDEASGAVADPLALPPAAPSS